MTVRAQERVPAPVVVDGTADIDIPSRTLAVRVSERESGYNRLWWREAHTALKAAEESGWRSHRAVYASAPGASDVAHATPGDYGMLLVRFQSGMQAFAELVGKPGLSALVSIDRSSGRFMGVRFLNRP
ncbi:MAG TPA: hypothetical protein VI094_19245 [Propionibacteriaceae bacterium]